MEIMQSRNLNEPTRFWGLTQTDGAVLGLIFCVGAWALSETPYAPWTFVIPLVPLFGLIYVRTKYRKKIIRDWVSSHTLPRRLYGYVCHRTFSRTFTR